MSIPVELADGRKLEFPDGTDPLVIQTTVKKLVTGIAPEKPAEFKPSLPNQVGPAEPILNMLSGIVAKPVSDVAGLAATAKDFISGTQGDPEGFKKYIQDKLTYAPRSDLGKTLTESPLNPVNMIGNVVGGVSQGAGNMVRGDSTNPLREAAGNAVQEAIPQGIGVLGASTIPVPNWVTNNPVTRGMSHIFEKTDTRSGRLLAEAGGPRTDALIQALRSPDLPAGTVGEAVSGQGAAELSALQKLSGKRYLPSEYAAKTNTGNEALVNALQTVGKTPDELSAALKTRGENYGQNFSKVANDLINPASEQQIWDSAIANKAASKGEALRDWGRFATIAAENETRGANFTPVAGMPRVSARASNFPERVSEYASGATDAKAIATKRMLEQQYLENAMDSLKNMKGIDDTSFGNFANRPSIRAAVQDALNSAMEQGVYFPAAKGEQFSVQNLQRIKKALDENVAQKLNTGIGPKDASIAEVEGTRKSFIDWLGKKSPGWEDARAQFARESVPINQMQIGQYLQNKLVPALADEGATPALRASSFAQAVREAPQTIKRATGAPMYKDLADILSQPQLQTVSDVGASLGRTAKNDQLATQGMDSIRRMIGENVTEIPTPGLLNRSMMAFNFAKNRLAGRASEASLKEIAKMMLDNPTKVADLMESATLKNKQALANYLMNPRLLMTAPSAQQTE